MENALVWCTSMATIFSILTVNVVNTRDAKKHTLLVSSAYHVTLSKGNLLLLAGNIEINCLLFNFL